MRRVGNKELPELSLLKQKRRSSRLLEKEDSFKDEIAGEDNEKISGSTEEMFLLITSENEVGFKWKEIQDEYHKLNPNLHIVYMRFQKKEGHIGIFHDTKKNLNFIKKFNLKEVDFTVKKCEGDDLINFWKDHGSHYENCVKRVKRQEKKKAKDELNEKRAKNFLKNEVQLGNLK